MRSQDYIMEILEYLDRKQDEVGRASALVAVRDKLTIDHRAAVLGYLKITDSAAPASRDHQ